MPYRVSFHVGHSAAIHCIALFPFIIRSHSLVVVVVVVVVVVLETSKALSTSPNAVVFTTSRTGSKEKQTIFIIVIVACAVVLLAVVLTLIYCFVQKKRRAFEFADAKYSRTTGEVAFEVTQTRITSSVSSTESAAMRRRSSMRVRLESRHAHLLEMELPLDKEWEFDRNQLHILDVLGEGAFGRVMKAEAFGLKNIPMTIVAVKMLKGMKLGLCIYLIVNTSFSHMHLTTDVFILETDDCSTEFSVSCYASLIRPM